MKVCVLTHPARVETNPLEWREVPCAEPLAGEVLIRARTCGVCRNGERVIRSVASNIRADGRDLIALAAVLVNR